jgi:hypothetical protein
VRTLPQHADDASAQLGEAPPYGGSEMNASQEPESPPEGVDGSARIPTSVRGVGAHVDDVNGYTHCQLSVLPGEVRLRLGGPLARVAGLHGKTLIHRGPDITLARVRWEVPWRRAALLLPSTEHRALVPLSRRAADALIEEMRQSGFQVSEVSVGHFGAAVALLADLSWKQVGRRRRQNRPPSDEA